MSRRRRKGGVGENPRDNDVYSEKKREKGK